MKIDMLRILKEAGNNQSAALERLFELLKLQSISTDPSYHNACVATADFLVRDLKAIGFEAERIDSDGKPFVFAHWIIDQNKPTVLFYGHYDVQPVDPIDLWESDPFSPQIKHTDNNGDVIIARGAADDKGQLMTFIEACRSIVAVTGELPVNVKIILEGEEESGSPSLPAFLQEHGQKLTADIALVCDTNMWDAQTPALITMLRGMITMEITVTAADRDLHSGYYGGAARNPLHILTKALSDLHDENGTVLIEGFYDGVKEVNSTQLEQWRALNLTAEKFLNPIGLNSPAGEKGRLILEQIWSRPTCEINGLIGGYTGEGFKTVIPSQAMVKLSCRLVPNQDPDHIISAIKMYFKRYVPEDCSIEFTLFGANKAISQQIDTPFVKAASNALKQEWGKDSVIAGCGGSIPIVGDFKEKLGLDSLLIGFGLEDDCIHSPNEKYNLSSFQKGQNSWIRILYAF